MIEMKNTIKLFDPVANVNEKKAIIDVLDSKFWASGSGSGNVHKFEEKFRKSEFIYLLIYRFVGGIPFQIQNVLPCIFDVVGSKSKIGDFCV